MNPLNNIIESLNNYIKTGDTFRIKSVIEQIGIDNVIKEINLPSSEKYKENFETNFHEGLYNCLKHMRFEEFKELVEFSVKFDVFVDVKRINGRFEILSELLLNCIEEVATGYQTSALGKIIEILHFFNSYNLLERIFDNNELKVIEETKCYTVFISNLKDLFGYVSNSLIFYVRKIIPQNLYDYFITEENMYYMSKDQLAYYIKNVFFNQYSIYGLSVKYLGSLKEFLKEFRKNQEIHKQNINKNRNLIEFLIKSKYKIPFYGLEEEREEIVVKKHLVSLSNILKNLEKILEKDNYNFYSLSMVLLGGIGPTGTGFTYSTPRGEVVEICSDIKENEAIIVKYKQFLKMQFLRRLEKEMKRLQMESFIIKRIIDYLREVLNSTELINYYKKDAIFSRIRNFIGEIQITQPKHEEHFIILLEKISNAISVILRPINMKDQFIARMELIQEDGIKSEEIAKLTSLKGKSHYDVLRERVFYQYVVDWFYELYISRRFEKD